MTTPLHMLSIHILGLLLLLSTSAVQAATVIELQSSNELVTLATDGQRARMNMSADEYVIVDYKDHTVMVVSPKQQQVMLLDAGKAGTGSKGPRVHTSFKNLGTGVVVAGYPTQKYAYSANGKSCGLIYGSSEVYQQQGIKEMFKAVDAMMEKQRAALGGFASMIDDCTLAEMGVSDHVKTVGVPMRTEKNGRIDTEIKSIKHNVTLPENTFVVPASYKTVSMNGQVNGVSGDTGNARQQKQQPQMQQMMRQYQQSGQLTPEMIEQIRRGQEMMRQYQQPRY